MAYKIPEGLLKEVPSSRGNANKQAALRRRLLREKNGVVDQLQEDKPNSTRNEVTDLIMKRKRGF